MPPSPRQTDETKGAVTREVPVELGQKALDAIVRALFSLSWNQARDHVRSGKITVNGATRTDPLLRVRAGSAIAFRVAAPRVRAEHLPEAAIVHVDAHVLVIDKPAGVSTVPYEPGEKGTLEERARFWLQRHDPRGESGGKRPALGVVQRLDKETSGLIVFARSWLAKQRLASQFREHTVHRRYLAIAHGKVLSSTIRSRLIANRGDGLRGSFKGPGTQGQPAVTHVEALRALPGATLIACVLETGRTHQIRVHLSESGHPLVGERVYVRGYPGTLLPAPRLMLHARELGFVHPKTEEDVRWLREPPDDFTETLRRLSVGSPGDSVTLP